MNIRSHSLRPCWLRSRLSAVVLISLLQRTPALRLVEGTVAFFAGSPLGAVLKSAIATLGALGAVNSLAGATTLVASTPSPVAITAGQPAAPIAFTVTDTINIASWRIGGTLPPGMKLMASQGDAELTGPGTIDATTPGTGAVDPYDPYASGGDGNLTTTPVLVGTPTQAGTYTFSLQAYELPSLSGLASASFNYTITVAASTQAGSAPAFTTQPAPQTVNAGSSVTLSAAASGSPAPAYQWRKDGTALPGATSATLTLSNVQVADAGSYTVVATNASGAVTSTAVALAVNAPTGGAAPAIARQPQAQTVAAGSTVVFNASATGSGLLYQWRKDGAAISGATRAALVLNGATAGNVGAYSVVISNSAGSITSSTAALLVANEINFGHLVNLSIRTSISAAEPFFTVGTVVGGAGTSGAKPLLVRAVGPSLAAFGISGAIADSRVDVFAGTAVVAA